MALRLRAYDQAYTASMRRNPDRLEALRKLVILDSSPEQAFDDIARLLADGLDVPIAMVNMLDENRDWFKACIGFPASESPVETSFCQVMLEVQDAVVISPDTTLDARFAENPFVKGPPHVRFYASARLAIDGQVVGTICAYDFKPRQMSKEQIDNMRVLAESATSLLMQRLQSSRSQQP